MGTVQWHSLCWQQLWPPSSSKTFIQKETCTHRALPTPRFPAWGQTMLSLFWALHRNELTQHVTFWVWILPSPFGQLVALQAWLSGRLRKVESLQVIWCCVLAVVQMPLVSLCLATNKAGAGRTAFPFSPQLHALCPSCQLCCCY